MSNYYKYLKYKKKKVFWFKKSGSKHEGKVENIHVKVFDLGGELLLDEHLEPIVNIKELKELLTKRKGIAPWFNQRIQTLLHDNEIVENS